LGFSGNVPLVARGRIDRRSAASVKAIVASAQTRSTQTIYEELIDGPPRTRWRSAGSANLRPTRAGDEGFEAIMTVLDREFSPAQDGVESAGRSRLRRALSCPRC